MKLRQWCLAAMCAVMMPTAVWAAQADIAVTGWTATWSSGDPTPVLRINTQLIRVADAEKDAAAMVEQEYREALEVYPEASPYVYRSEIKPDAETSRYLVTVLSSRSYTGGAHGYYSEQYFVFDKTTGAQVPLSEIAGQEREMLYPKLAAYVETELSRRIDGYDDLWRESLRECFAAQRELNYRILPSGQVQLVFNPYEVAPFAVGIVRIDVPTTIVPSVS